jgi:hypothetical protein
VQEALPSLSLEAPQDAGMVAKVGDPVLYQRSHGTMPEQIDLYDVKWTEDLMIPGCQVSHLDWTVLADRSHPS